MAVSVDLATLHSLVLANNYSQLDTLLTSISDKSIMQKPFCGQTMLTLAVTLGHIDCVKLLLKHGSTALEKNEFGWSAYNESISYGNRDILKLMYLSKRAEYANWVNSKGAELLKQVNNDLMDVEFDMAWSFKSIIPFVSSLCPYDEYKVYKKGANIRIDTTLVGYEQLNWIRGNISIIFLGDVKNAKLVVLDHERKIVQQIWPGDFSIKDEQIEEDISIALNTPNVLFADFSMQVPTSISKARLFLVQKVGSYSR